MLAGIEVFIGSKVCFETCTTKGRGGEEGGSANSKTSTQNGKTYPDQ